MEIYTLLLACIHFLFKFYRIFLSIIGLPYESPAMT